MCSDRVVSKIKQNEEVLGLQGLSELGQPFSLIFLTTCGTVLIYAYR